MNRSERVCKIRLLGAALLAVVVLTGCVRGASETPAYAPSPTATSRYSEQAGLTAEEAMTLESLTKVDEYPLYTLHFYAPYDLAASAQDVAGHSSDLTERACESNWACSLFASLGDESKMLFGRNFDWDFSPAMLLFTHPSTGYASVSMVDIAYLGFGDDSAHELTELPIEERVPLLQAPLLPFDGMNERGLAIGMAAVPSGNMTSDPDKDTVGSLRVMRMILDQAATIDEAVAILENHNIDFRGGPPLHYLVADATGRAVLVEFYAGRMVVLTTSNPWHQATNFLRSSVGESAEGNCWRYDLIGERLADSAGEMSAEEALTLLQDVSQPNTQWSIVYGISAGEILVSMGREYNQVHTFHLAAP
jgi:hypothetical protein